MHASDLRRVQKRSSVGKEREEKGSQARANGNEEEYRVDEGKNG